MKHLSTSAIAGQIEVNSRMLFEQLNAQGWIKRKDEYWALTQLGKDKGGDTKKYPKTGEYIVWPESIIPELERIIKKDLLNATALGKHFGVTSQRLNLILSELGWIEKSISGWSITKLGKRLSGCQFEHQASGGTYVLWPKDIIEEVNLQAVFKFYSTQDSSADSSKKGHGFREKYPATLRTKDGHMVRSRAEVIIDNALYDYKLAHAYERKLPVAEELYSDFFIPSENVYIEY